MNQADRLAESERSRGGGAALSDRGAAERSCMAVAGMGMYQSNGSYFAQYSGGGLKESSGSEKSFGHFLAQYVG